MSGIFGLFHRDGAPVAPASLDGMRQAMAYWGPDGTGVWQNSAVGLGHLLRHNTPESVHETMPLASPDGDLVLTAVARLDNRTELCEALGVPQVDRAKTPDGALILRAYRTWGEACPEHLLGDWSFAVWDVGQRKLFVARDHYGNTAMYSYHNARCFAFASCVKGLFALPQVPRRLNELWLARLLTVWPGDEALTPYEGILRLPAAHSMTVTADRIEIREYWRLEDTPALRLPSDDAYVEAFLTVYGEAVRCRLRSHRPVGVTLSGGLDSGSVAALAARELRQTQRRLPAFTSVPLYDTQHTTAPSHIGDEWPLAEATARCAGSVDLQPIRADDVTPLAGIQRGLWVHDSPCSAAGNYYWIIALLQAAQARNLGALLTGQRGNATVSWSGGDGATLALLLAGAWRAAWCELRGAQRVTDTPLWRLLWRHIARPLLLPLRKQRYRLSLRPKEPWAFYSAINPAFARRLDLRRRMRQTGHDPTFSGFADPRQEHRTLMRVEITATGALWSELGAAYGTEVRDPTADKRVIEFCLAIPDEQYVRHGQNRSLIRRAMAGLLPPEVRLNTRRGRQAADLGHRIVASRDEMRAALARLDSSPLARAYLHLPLLQQVFAALQERVDPTTTSHSVMFLTRGLSAGLFLLTFEER